MELTVYPESFGPIKDLVRIGMQRLFHCLKRVHYSPAAIEPLKPLGVGHFHTAILRFPLVQCRFCDPVPATYFGSFQPASASRKIPLICSSLYRLPFICPSPSGDELYVNSWDFSGGTPLPKSIWP